TKEAPQQFQFHSFQIGQQGIQVKDAQMPEKVEVAPGEGATTWMLFPEIPSGSHIPPMQLKIKTPGTPVEFDINGVAREQLGIEVERIGPRKSLGLISVTGELTNISTGILADELEKLVADRVVRAVVTFRSGARLVDYQLHNWIQNAAQIVGRGQQMGDTQFPALPAALRELHLVNLPNPGNQGQPGPSQENQPKPPPPVVANVVLFGGGGPNTAPRLHATEVDAVISALRSAFENLPRPELVRSLGSANRLERAAALAGGAARLADDKLPLVLDAVQDDDVIIQQTALAALSNFGTPEAVGRLVSVARRNTEPVSSTAIASLAGSRYTAAHEALLLLLRDEPPELKKTIVRTLAQFPKPLWSEAIYEFVQDGRQGLNVEALNALVQVGHPRLVEVLAKALKGEDDALRQQALTVLISRSDRESEEIALEFTVAYLADKEPIGSMYTLLNRVKDRRTLPLLLAKFDASQNKTSLIQTIALMGDQETAKLLVEKFPKLQPHEKGTVIQVMARLDKLRFRELAREALLAKDGSLFNYAIQGLQEDGGPETVRLMIEALEKAEQPHVWNQLMYSLANTGSPQARAALIKARDSGDVNKKNVAVGALQNMKYRSPGWQFYSQAQAMMREQKYKEAAEQFALSIQMDPGFADSYAERGIALMHLEKWDEAGKDFAKGWELDPYNSLALTGQCLVGILAGGKVEDAVKKLEENREKFPSNPVFQYNAACVYGRAYERVAKDEASPERDKKLQEFKTAGLADLKKSLEMGFQDVELMKKDPDLAPFREMPEWEELQKSKPDATKPANVGGPAAMLRRARVQLAVPQVAK
ncbi:MAG: HEAT repeat domain-containing protein, partial [Planctomycetota bacterium]|nr:HEAT repeat domain-containing protein [Planctomycetota bacterium]